MTPDQDWQDDEDDDRDGPLPPDDRDWRSYCMRDRAPNGMPTRRCEAPPSICPEENNGWLHMGRVLAGDATRILEGKAPIYWHHQHLCADERYPQFTHQFRKCESPIEVTLLCAIYAWAGWDIHRGLIELDAQHDLPDGYRADIWINHLRSGQEFDIECDGKDFHDKERDAARDERLLSRGIIVLRYTGSQIRQDREAVSSMVDGRVHHQRVPVKG